MRMLLWHVLPLTFAMILSSCTRKAPEELRTNVLNNYKDDIALLERYRFPYPFLKEKIKKGKISKRQDIRRVIMAYEKLEVIKEENRRIIVGGYAYDMGLYGKAYMTRETANV